MDRWPARSTLELHVFVDHSVVEVFVDDREAFSTRVFPTLESSTAIDLFAEGGVATAEQVDVWQMNDAAH
jgi:beta-fructofuranosidase